MPSSFDSSVQIVRSDIASEDYPRYIASLMAGPEDRATQLTHVPYVGESTFEAFDQLNFSEDQSVASSVTVTEHDSSDEFGLQSCMARSRLEPCVSDSGDDDEDDSDDDSSSSDSDMRSIHCTCGRCRGVYLQGVLPPFSMRLGQRRTYAQRCWFEEHDGLH